jgi:hypothetical protein
VGRYQKHKGGRFERLLCAALSRWWTRSDRDDVFIKTESSGARGTVRARRGKQTYQQYGDIHPNDPVGEPLFRVFVMEAKKGYNRATLADVLDRPSGGAQQEWEAWVQQAVTACENSTVGFWMLVHMRDKRRPTAFVPWDFVDDLRVIRKVDLSRCVRPFVRFTFHLRVRDLQTKAYGESRLVDLAAFPFDLFLECVAPEDVKAMADF